jgi:hypothetical protein
LPETNEHKTIKEIVLKSMQELFEAGLIEYAHTGHVNDVYVVTNEGIKIFVETVWTSTRSNFERDLNILHRSDADVKLLIVNPEILAKEELFRSYEKTKLSERAKGIAISNMIDGSQIIRDPNFVKNMFQKIVQELVSTIRERNSQSKRPSSDIKPFSNQTKASVSNSSTIVYCSRCGTKPGQKSPCLVGYLRHDFVSG